MWRLLGASGPGGARRLTGGTTAAPDGPSASLLVNPNQPPPPGSPYAQQRRVRLHDFHPAAWEPTSATLHYRLAPETLLGPGAPLSTAVEVAVGGRVLHCETSFERRRRRAPQGLPGELESSAGYDYDDYDDEERSEEGGDQVGYDCVPAGRAFPGATPGGFGGSVGRAYSHAGGGGWGAAAEGGGGEGAALPLVVTTLRGVGVQAALKPGGWDAAKGWAEVPMRLGPAELLDVYEFQTAAVGAEYNEGAVASLVLGYMGCPRAASATSADRYTCSELVAASLRGTRLEHPLPPSAVNPEALVRHLLRLEAADAPPPAVDMRRPAGLPGASPTSPSYRSHVQTDGWWRRSPAPSGGFVRAARAEGCL